MLNFGCPVILIQESVMMKAVEENECPSSKSIKVEPKESLHLVCRLCLSEESLDDVFKAADLNKWISDLLSIMITTEDRMSQSICEICRIRLTEFHKFRINCQDVQNVLKSMIQTNDIDRRKSWPQNDQQDHEKEDAVISFHAGEEPTREENMIDIEEVKIETGSDDKLERSSKTPVKPTSTMNGFTRNAIEFMRKPVGRIIRQKIKNKTRQPVECNICQKVLKSRRHFWQHNKQTHAPKTHFCHICGNGFPFRSNLVQHLQSRKHSEEPQQLLSEIDNKLNEGVEGNSRDTKNQHPSDCSINTSTAKGSTDEEPKKHSCNICHKIFPSVKQLKNHRRYHKAKTQVCSICEKPFANRFILQRHTLIHESVDSRQRARMLPERFQCDVCQMVFIRQATMMAHIQEKHHSTIYPCQICSAKFRTRALLNDHLKEKGHENESS